MIFILLILNTVLGRNLLLDEEKNKELGFDVSIEDMDLERSGAGGRFKNLNSMIWHYNENYKFLRTFVYGCNCLFHTQKPMRQTTFGHPVDAMDSLCLKWKQCQKCAYAIHGTWCTNEDNFYGVTGIGPSFLEHYNGGDEAVCTDEPWSCGRQLCECDRMFAKEYEQAYSTWSHLNHVFLSEFNPTSECVKPSPHGKPECCWAGDGPSHVYNPERKVCCQDGEIADSVEQCKQTEMFPISGYGK